MVPDAQQDDRFRLNPKVTGELGTIRFYAGHPLEAPGGERIGALCIFDSQPRQFSETEARALRDLAEWVQHELSLSEELAHAIQVQRGLLPKQFLSLPGFDVAGACVPTRSVGGDFYDWYPIGEGAAFTLGDVMGKGVGAALIAATVRGVLRAGSNRGASWPRFRRRPASSRSTSMRRAPSSRSSTVVSTCTPVSCGLWMPGTASRS